MSIEERMAKIEEIERRIFFIECADRLTQEDRDALDDLKKQLKELESNDNQ